MKQSRLSGAISLMIAQAIVLVFGYVAHLWIGRVLGPGPYGVYGIILSMQTIVGLLLTLGVPVAISRFVAQNENQALPILRQGLRIQIVIAMLISATTALFSSTIAKILGDTSLTGLVQFVSLVIFAQALYPVYIQFFSGRHLFYRQALLTSLYATAKLIGAIALIYTLGVLGALAGFAIGGIIAAIIGWMWTRKDVKNNENKNTKLLWQDYLKFAGVYVLILIALQLLMSIDLFMIKALLQNDVQTGYYNAATTLARIPYFLLQGLSFVILPSVSKLTRPGSDKAEAVAFIKETMRYLIAIVVFGVALAATTSQSLVQLFYSSGYLPAAPVLTVLVIGLGSLAFFLLLANIAAGAGKARPVLYIAIFSLAISAAAGTVLIPRFGLIGAALQTTLASAIGLLVLGLYTLKTFNISFPVKSTVNILIATAIVTSLTYLWEPPSFLLPVLYTIIGILYLGALFLLGEITKNDRRLVANLHPKLSWIAGKK